MFSGKIDWKRGLSVRFIESFMESKESVMPNLCNLEGKDRKTNCESKTNA